MEIENVTMPKAELERLLRDSAHVALLRAKAAVGAEWFSGNRHRYASELGPACEIAVQRLIDEVCK